MRPYNTKEEVDADYRKEVAIHARRAVTELEARPASTVRQFIKTSESVRKRAMRVCKTLGYEGNEEYPPVLRLSETLGSYGNQEVLMELKSQEDRFYSQKR